MRESDHVNYRHGDDIVQVRRNGSPTTLRVSAISTKTFVCHSEATMTQADIDRLLSTGRYTPTDEVLCLVPA